MNDNDKTPLDTTGLTGLARARALCAIADAQAAGKPIQLRAPFLARWQDARIECSFGDATTDYRVKPEPEVTTLTKYVLYVPMPGGERLRHRANYVGTYGTRREALADAAHYVGECLIDEIEVTYTDGVETSRTKGVRL